ncbi:hypothetical protein OESDEN_03761 [Oesophagostomum dentatum]|uniref:Uncharacterized protein n=1 Tax=Oesophagostomum dentatum TaxID=61180 RepID=A0A0B1TGA1_OESDE|nr:hypothetical protein OESDEN_03761 [Oesophagostomum dentatum]
MCSNRYADNALSTEGRLEFGASNPVCGGSSEGRAPRLCPVVSFSLQSTAIRAVLPGRMPSPLKGYVPSVAIKLLENTTERSAVMDVKVGPFSIKLFFLALEL